MLKIGILGGTFNPIHNGHLILAETARQAYGLDKVLLIPSGCSYMKDQKEILPGSVRLEMTRLAAQDNPCFEASDVEVEWEGNTYTFETLRRLRSIYPTAEFYFIIGADTLYNMNFWKNPELIFAETVILVSVRDGCQDEGLSREIRQMEEKYHADIRLLSSLHVEISSTDIRSRCREGRSIRYLVPESVRIFLEENGYYR